MSQGIFSSVTQVFKGIFSSITQVFSKLDIRKMTTKLIMKVSEKSRELVQKMTNFLTSALQKPKSKDDYVLFKDKYISKKILLMGCAVVVLGGYFLCAYAYPWADGNLWRTSIEYGNEKYKSFSGKVRIYYNNKTIYIGEMSEGKLSGKGKQYDENKKLVYEGEFEGDMYSGEGILYQDDVAVYKGGFSNNLFEGSGEQYNSKGKMVYKGDFTLGQRSGKGIEYDPDTGKKIYSGDWVSDLREGDGTEFKDDGVSKVYKGAFVAGLYEGEGSLFEDGQLKYKGNFQEGKYSGSGCLYDTVTGKTIYDGDFADGKYEGEGSLFDVTSGKVIYKGSFLAGKADGQGESYDKLGAVIYKGDFSEGNIAYLNYIGKTFDDISKEFGRESFLKEVDDSLVVTYLNKNISMIFKKGSDQEETATRGSYECEKIFVDLKKASFKGLAKNSSKEQVESLLGPPYSSFNYAVNKVMEAAFKGLSIDIKSSNLSPSDKFIMGDYMVRLFYNQSRDTILAAEVSSM